MISKIDATLKNSKPLLKLIRIVSTVNNQFLISNF